MSVTFADVLKKYRNESISEAEKGGEFEKLMRRFLLAAPRYSGMFKKVWLWRDFPFRKDFGDGHDIGIDIVAVTNSGEYWAVQCKCYSEEAYINQEEVASFISASSKSFSDGGMAKKQFARRLWLSTTNHWSSHAESALKNQNPPVMRLGFSELSSMEVDWEALLQDKPQTIEKRKPLEHQCEAIAAAHEYYKTNTRGKLIMACGTGKTYTSLKIAENEVKASGLVLFLVPSISLLGQTLDEWTTHAENKIRSMCVCSDAEVSRKHTTDDDGEGNIVDLAYPASTNTMEICRQFHELEKMTNKGFRVVFSTYQSLPRVVEAQKRLNKEKPGQADFDLVICDEAHRTVGAFDGKNASAFILVHDNSKLIAKNRMYMTATSRIYNDKAKEDAKEEADIFLCSMDDEAIYGKEFYKISFNKAVQKGLLADYKVVILTVPDVTPELKEKVKSSNGEIEMDDAAKLIGCTNALSKIMCKDSEILRKEDPSLMHKAVAFCASINDSKRIVHAFKELRDTWLDSLSKEERDVRVAIEAEHVDGHMDAGERQEKLAWLKNVDTDTNACHLLSNVRCLSEGVDVPSLDAILFLSARNSSIDVVQSVGRVMRKSRDKRYGYVIIPVVIPPNVSPEDALDKSDVYNVVWTVLTALRAHDEGFEAEVNKLALNNFVSNKIVVGAVDIKHKQKNVIGKNGTSGKDPEQMQIDFDLRKKIYGKMVEKVGTRRYWSFWANEVGKLAKKQAERMNALIQENSSKRSEFDEFLASLRKNLNPGVTEKEAADMLVMHTLTKPIFDAVFQGYDFAASNVVSKSMQKMMDILQEDIPESEARTMDEFYKAVASRASGIDNAEGRQKVIYELYDRFFRTAFPELAEQLGIVYTPVECVDFIVNSVEQILQKDFNQSLSDEGVHIIDPFTGTGTFMTRLLQSGHIRPTDLKRKYASELHANEIVLLAYYIAAVNIESVYHDLVGKNKYIPFEGICLTDTFALYEKEFVMPTPDFQQNSERVVKQHATPVRVIIGNPPYSVGQKSANDNAQNQHYPLLEKKIAATYAAGTKATLKMSLYDSYIKAFRWSTDRLNGDKGIIAFISNSGWLDGNAMDGFRACLEKEFDDIYVFDLRGNQRTSGELSRKEGGKIFGSGSRTPIAITILVKKFNQADETERERERERERRPRGHTLPRHWRLPYTRQETLNYPGIWRHKWSSLENHQTKCSTRLAKSA